MHPAYLDQWRGDKTLEKYTSVLRENVEELNGLIQEILDFRKAEDAGFSHTHIRRVSVSSLLRTQFEWFYPLSEQHQIQFKIDAPKELYWNTDSVYFKKILANLISNAFKYTEDGGTVRISLHEEENFLVLKVYNTGKGIEEADMQNIFDRYRILGTMDNDDNRQNTTRNGLGLFICHSLVLNIDNIIICKMKAHFRPYIPREILIAIRRKTGQFESRTIDLISFIHLILPTFRPTV